mgnify:CR=1 FL=1
MNSFYTLEDFAFNSSWKVGMFNYRDHPILFIDDVYKHPLRVYGYLKQCPIRSHKGISDDSKNGKWFYDGQHYVNNKWDPCREKLFDKIIDFYNITPDPKAEYPPLSMYNQFRLIENHPGQDYFFSPHIDNKLNLCLYLNPDCGGSSGTTIYWPTSEDSEEMLGRNTEHSDPWMNTMYRPELSIISKFNSMVVFPGQWPHGQTIIDNRFKEKTRFTEVAFF